MMTPRSIDWIRGYAFRDLETKILRGFYTEARVRKPNVRVIEVNVDIPKCWFNVEKDYRTRTPHLPYCEMILECIMKDLSLIFGDYKFTGEVSPNKQYMNFKLNVVNTNPIEMTQEQIEEVLGYKIKIINCEF